MTEHKNVEMALAAAQSEMGALVKGKANPFFKSKYADLSDVVDAARPALNAHGISYYHTMRNMEGSEYMVTILAHGQSDTRIECAVPLVNAGKDMQTMKSATTYAKRIGLESLTGIAPEDDDGNAAAQGAKQQRAAPKPLPSGSVGPLDANGRSNRDLKDQYNKLKTALGSCGSIEALGSWSDAWGDELEDMPEEYREDLRGVYKTMRDGFKAVVA